MERACDLADARRYLGRRAPVAATVAFARRQIEARRRLGDLVRFYDAHPSSMARVHLLTAHAVTLGRFWGVSETFAAMGRAFMPVDEAGRPRTASWSAYAAACAARRPAPSCDELWIAAHALDFLAVRDAGLDRAFHAEAAAHPREPTWQALSLHMAMTLDARLTDALALAGDWAYETAIAQSMGLALARIARAGGALLARYAAEAARAILSPPREPARGLPGHRAMALGLVRHALGAARALGVYRRGVRRRARGRVAGGADAWPLLEEVLGPRVAEVDPLVVAFYRNPARFAVRASLDLHTLPARLWSRVATLLVGQGLFESHLDDIEARFRVFRRADGSMHFVRELFCEGALREFDSDFVVRRAGGRPVLVEVFVDEGIEVEMDVAPLEGGGLSIRGREVRVRGVRVPRLGLDVEFQSRPARGPAGEELRIDGHLRLRPRTALGRFLAHRVLRRPVELGCIHYVARASSDSPR